MPPTFAAAPRPGTTRTRVALAAWRLDLWPPPRAKWRRAAWRCRCNRYLRGGAGWRLGLHRVRAFKWQGSSGSSGGSSGSGSSGGSGDNRGSGSSSGSSALRMEVALRGFLIGGCRDSTAATAAAGRAGSSSAVVPPPTLDGGSQEPPGRPFRSCSRSRVAQTTKELTETCAPQAPLDPVPQAAHSHRKDPAASCLCSPSLCATLDACFSALSIDPLPLPLLPPHTSNRPAISVLLELHGRQYGRPAPPSPPPDPQNGTNRRRGVIEHLLQLEGDGAAIRSTADVVAAAEASGSGATVLRLLQLGCPRPDRSECVVAAASEGRLEMLRWLLKYGDALGIKGRRGAAAVGTDRSAAAAAGLSRAALCCWRRCPGGRTRHHTMQLGWGRQCERCWSTGWAAGAAAGASHCHVTTAPRC